jgi:predicted tellurium resistance membrane protein TerC
MPLSDEHRRALDEIERQLVSEDPNFAASVNHDRFRQLRRRWVIIPAVMFVLGAVLMIAGLVTTHELLVVGAIIGVVGFLTMPTAVALFFRHHPQLWESVKAIR